MLTNPEVLRETVNSGGQNLVKGLNNLLEDLESGNGQQMRVKMTDPSAFQVGGNLAVTPGKVVYQNDLMQLIQYAPLTQEVYKRPLLILPPWINKFYILDMREKNSFVRWATAQGHTVFIVSWVNPDAAHAQKTFDDYLLEGPLAALDAIEQATGEREVNAIGFCLGGTLLAAALAYMAAKQDNRIKSATFFASMIDFAEPGELEVFIDEKQVSNLEKKNAGARLSRRLGNGDHVQHAARQRPDLVVRRQQLSARQGPVPVRPAVLELGLDAHAGGDAQLLSAQHVHQEPAAPAGRHHAERRADRPHQSENPRFISRRPSKTTSRRGNRPTPGAQLFPGKVRFVLGGSGHIAGIVNPPAANKYGYWTNDKLADTPQAWLDGATQHPGSWWTDWAQWVEPYAGDKVAAREPGKGKLKALEDAPGSYVKLRLDEKKAAA